MLLCETARDGRTDAEHLAIFASQLAALGLPARIAVDAVPAEPSLNLQFDLAPFLHEGGLRPRDDLVLLAADQLTDATLARLRRLAGDAAITARAFGDFGRPQAALGVRARLSYVLGREPELFDLGPGRTAPAFGVVDGPPEPFPEAPRLLLVGPDLKDPLQAAVLNALAPRRSLRTTVVTDSRSKRAWISAHGQGLAIFAYGEALPLALAGRTDLAIFFVRIEGSYRVEVLAANLLAAGRPLLDGTAGHANAAGSDAFVPAPHGLVGLDGYLDAEILPNLASIAAHVRASRAAAAARPDRVLGFLGHAPAERARSRR